MKSSVTVTVTVKSLYVIHFGLNLDKQDKQINVIYKCMVIVIKDVPIMTDKSKMS